MLNDNDRRQYNIQRVKWEAEQRKVEKTRHLGEPKDKIYEINIVEKMINGNYWSDSDDDDDRPKKRRERKQEEEEQTTFLGRHGIHEEIKLA